jgi:hypothetical protein
MQQAGKRAAPGWPVLAMSIEPQYDSVRAAQQRIQVSMVSLKWGDALSILLPGAVALYAASVYFPLLRAIFHEPSKIDAGTGVVLLIAAALAGGILEAITRIWWEPYWLVRRCPSSGALSQLTAENIELYERGVQNSYKYATFYANFAWALVFLSFTRATHDQMFSVGTLMLIGATLILLRASYVQWTYYVNYMKTVFPAKPKERAWLP